MTGEITLRGRVLPVGGVREKVMAAHRTHMKIVMIPERNEKDLVDVPRKVREDLKIILVNHMDQVVQVAVAPDVVIEPPHPRKRASDEQNEVYAEDGE